MLNLILGFIFGTVLGSFVDCISNRSLTKKSFWGRSFCDSCHKHLHWYDLFPIFSYLALTGRCRYCKSKIPLEALVVELVMGLLISLLFIQSDFVSLVQSLSLASLPSLTGIFFKCFIIVILVSVFITDIKTGLIPDRITYPSILIAAVYLLMLTIIKISLLYLSLIQNPIGKYLLPPGSDYFLRHALIEATPLTEGILAGLLIGGFFLSLIMITRGRGMGGGDLKLGIFMGLIFGILNSVMALMLSFLTGSLAGIILLILGRKKFGQTIPFGPFLTIGSLATLFFGRELLNFYLNLKF